MDGKTFDLVEFISDLLRRIEEGRQTFRDTQNVRDDFRSICVNRDTASQLSNDLQLMMVSLDEPAKSQVKAEQARQRAEFQVLNDEASRRWPEVNGTTAFIDPFRKDVLLLLERLPLKHEWDVFRQAVGRLDVRDHRCWTDPPANSTLDTLEMRLGEMLELAGGIQSEQVPTSHASRRDRGPNLEVSRQRIELTEKLRGELATIVLELQQPRTLGELQKKFPAFQIWHRLSGPEQEALLKEPIKPKAYAQQLVLRHYGLTSEETLKKDRKKLKRAAENKHPVP